MASSATTYAQMVRLLDSVTACKECFSRQHYDLLGDEALKKTRAGAEKLEYILALARRCRAGEVAVEGLGHEIDRQYSLSPATAIVAAPAPALALAPAASPSLNPSPPSPPPEPAPVLSEEEHGGGEEEMGEGQHRDGEEEESVAVDMDIDTDVDDSGDVMGGVAIEDHQQEQEEEEEEARLVSVEDVDELIKSHRGGFFRKSRWTHQCSPLIVPGEGYWIDSNHIQTIRSSTDEDLARATPKRMPVYIEPNPYPHGPSKFRFDKQKKCYHLCRSVAVAADGSIFRATDKEILAALAEIEDAPSTNAATYVKAVQELRRRLALDYASGRYIYGQK